MIKHAQAKHVDRNNEVITTHDCHLYCAIIKRGKIKSICDYLVGEIEDINGFEYKVNCKK